MKKLYFGFLAIFCLLISLVSNAQNTFYVKATSSGSADGSSWANASSNLQNIINGAASGDQVWVAAGTYLPTRNAFGNISSDRSRTFLLKNGVKLYGGFAGTETVLNQRNYATNATILSGDFNGDDGTSFSNYTENAYNVVIGLSVSNSTEFDGFIISHGNANGNYFFISGQIIINGAGGGMYSTNSNLALANLIFTDNFGNEGGAVQNNTSTGTVNYTNCSFTNNKAYYDGALYNYQTTSTLTNCIISGNSSIYNCGAVYGFYNAITMNNCVLSNNTCSSGSGGAILMRQCNYTANNTLFVNNSAVYGGAIANGGDNPSFSINNCTFYGNSATTNGKCISSNAGTNVNNSIFWGNSGNGAEIYGFNAGTISVNYSVVVTGTSDFSGSNNVSGDPKFKNASNAIGNDGIWRTADDGLMIGCVSSAYNTGNNSIATSTDIIGTTRPVFTTADRGAYESTTNLSSTSSSANITICPSQLPYNWNGYTFNTAGSQTATLTNSGGCDSVVTLNLTVGSTSISNTTTSACDSLVWNGTTYAASGIYTWIGINSTGCDSTATLNLTINASSTSSTSLSVCLSQLPYSWNGLTFNAAGSQTAHLNNSVGCDSAATLNLTVLSTSTSSTNVTICNNQTPYVWNANNYSSTGSYTVHFTNSVGCDSAATLNLTINSNPTVDSIVGLTNIEILAIGAGGGAGGPDGAIGAGGGAGGAVYGKYTLSASGSNIYTVGVGGAGGYGQGCAGNAAGGTAGANGGATGGNAGTGGCSGGGGGSGGWSGFYQGSTYYVVAGGGAGGGGSNEGTANDVTTPGGGNQSVANGTLMTGQNGTAYSGDGGGGGAGGGGFYGGAGQSNLTQTGFAASQSWGGANYSNPTGRNSFATYIGNSGATASTGTGGQGTTSTITNSANFNYSNTYGKGGNAQGNGGTATTANGNNGVVIIRYQGSPVATGGTVTQSGGYTLHTFTAAGSNTFRANSATAVCVGSTTSLSCATINGVWSSSDTTIATIDASTGMVTGITPGVVTIRYTVTNANGCVGYSTKQFTVNPLPTVPAITGNTTICDNTTTTLSNTLTGGVWSSSLTSKATVNSTSGLVSGVAAGTSTITYLYTDNNGCSNTNSTVVTINASPTVAAITGNAGVCIGSTTTFSNVTLNGTWTSSNTSVATINSSGLISTVATGSSTVSYTVINASSCTTFVTKSITVNALPNVTANATATTVCNGTSVTLTGGNASSYTWNNGITNNVAFTATATTAYTVTGTDGNGCVKTANITITVNPLPTVSISPSVTTLCNGYSSTLTASGASTYGWTIVGATPYIDQVSSTSTLKLAAGLHKLKSSYSGAALRIRRSSDNTEQDFGFSGNDLDVAAISTFIGGGTAYVKTLYDQSGNGNHLSQTSTGNQPTLTLSGLNGKPVIHTNTSQNIYNTINFTPPFSVVYAARQTGGSRGRLLSGTSNNWLLGWWGGNRGMAHFDGWITSSCCSASDNNVYVYSGTGTGSSSQAYQNKTSITTSPTGGTTGPNGISLNRNEASDADFTDVVEFNSVLSTADRNIVENGMGAYYGLSGFYNTTGASTTVTPNTTSSFTVYGTDGNGCIGTATQAITVNPKPNAGSDINYLCGGATQTLTGTANTGTWTALGTNPTGATLSSTTSGVATVAFTNLASGIFSFIYTLPTTNCSDTMSITVRPKPNAGADQAICILNVATGVTLTSNVTGVWSAKTGNAGTESIATSNAQSTLVNNFSVVGNYNYINTNNGCTDTVMVTVTPAGSIGNYVWKDQNNDGLQNEPTANGVNGITVELYKKDGTGAFNLYASTTTANNGGNPGYYNFGICEDGVYKVKVPIVNPFTQTHLTTQDATAATNGNSDVNPTDGFSPEVTIDTHSSGVAKDNNTIDAGYQICTKPIAGSDFNSCGGQLVAITGVSTTPALPTTDGNWTAVSSNPTGATLSSTVLGVSNVQFDVTASGVYSFIYAVTGGCDDTLNITVEAKPSAGADVSSICGGLTQTVVGSPAGGTWSAQIGNPSGATVGSTSNGVANIGFANLSSGLYTFIYTTVFGCTDTMTITAYPKPNAGNDVSYICGGHSQTITATPSTGTWSAMSGNPSGATVGATSNGVATIDFADLSNVTYSFIYTVPSGCTDTMRITAYAKPNAGSDLYEVCGGSILSLSGTPSTGTWSQAAANASGATVGSTTNGVAVISFSNLISGTYTFIFTSVAGCTDTMTISTKPKPNAGSDVYMECGTPRLFDTLRATPNRGVWTALSSNTNSVTLNTTDTSGRTRINLPTAPTQGTWTFIYTAPNGCTDTMSYTIGVTGTPAPAINSGSNPICGNSTVQICPTIFGWSNYQWYKNGVAVSGINGTQSCITVDTSKVGSYTLAGTNGSACWSKQSNPVVISLAGAVTPTITVQGGLTTACNNGSITLISSSTQNNQWNKNGIAISGATSQYYTASTSGVYTVTAINCGYTRTSSGTTITIVAPISISSIQASSGSVCTGSTLSLTNATTGGVWTSSNPSKATVSASTGLVTGLSVGSAIITYTVTVSGCSNATSYTLNVVDGSNISTPIISVQGSTTLCGTATVQLCTGTFGWSNYQWYKNGVAVTTGTGTCITVDTSKLGSYTLAASTGSGCWSPISNAVTVSSSTVLPSTPTVSATGSTTVCNNGTVVLSSSAATNNQWKKDGVIISGATSQSYTASASGVYTVSVSNCAGSSVSAGITVTIVPTITLGSIQSITSSVCKNATVTLTNSTTGGVWTSNNNLKATVNAASGSVTGVDTGSVTITYTVTVSGCSKSVSTTLTVVDGSNITAPIIAAQSQTSLCGTSSVQICPTTFGWSNYQWYKYGIAVTSNGAGACITIDTSKLGSYTLAATNGSGCWSIASNTIVISAATAPTVPTISISGSGTVCNGGTVTLTSSSTTGNQWNKDGVAISGATSQSYTASASGVYTVTVTNCGSAVSAGTSITVVPHITVNSIQSVTGTVCKNATSTLINTTTGGVWSSSNNSITTINSSTGLMSGVDTGIVTITYTVTVNGCSNFVQATFTVVDGSNIVPPTIVAQSSAVICSNGNVTICPTLFGWSNYQWYKNGVALTSNGAGACITVDTSKLGSYTLAATTGTCWSSQSNAITVSTLAAPATPTISASGSTTLCNGSNLVLTSSASSGNQWNKDGVAISGATSVTYVATIAGTYTATVTNCGGSTTSAGTTVSIAAPITLAAITSSSSNVCMGTTITLTNATSGGVWSSSNTSIATVNASGTVTPVSGGTVIISYTVTVGSCSNTVTYSLTVPSGSVAPPTIIAQSSTTLCGTNTVQLCPSTYGWSNYQWYKNGVAVTNNGASACIVIDTSKLGNYTLAATMGVCWTAQSNAISIGTASPPSLPTISTAGSTSICSGSSVTLTSSTTTGNQWNKDGVAISGATSQTYNATVSGVYTVTVTVCGSRTSVGTSVTVAAPISVAAINSSSSSICFGGTVTMTNATTGGVWSSNNTSVATINSSGIVTTVGAGTAVISYTVTAGSCSNAATYTLTVQSGSVAIPTLDIRGSVNICGSGSLQMCPLVWGYSNYQWYKDGVAYSTSSCITVNTAGSYTLTGTNGSGCWSSPSIPAVVTLNPIPTMVATTGPTAVCAGSSITLVNSSTIPSGGTGVWSSGALTNVIVGASTGVITGTNATSSVVVKYTVTSAVGCTNYTNYNVTINAIPSVPSITYAPGTVNPQAGAPTGSFCANRTFTVVGIPSGGVWSKTGPITVTTPAGVVTTGSAAGSGSIKYTYTDANGCVNSRTMVGNVYVCAARGIANTSEPLAISNDFTMYPNPARSQVSINVETLVGTGNIIVTDLYGKVVKSQTLSMGTNTLNISKLSAGMYLVSIITNEGKQTKKLIIE